jgi:hypothetical protein
MVVPLPFYTRQRANPGLSLNSKGAFINNLVVFGWSKNVEPD